MTAPAPPSRSGCPVLTWILLAAVVVLAGLLLARVHPGASPPPAPRPAPVAGKPAPAPGEPGPAPAKAASRGLPPLPAAEEARWEALAVSLAGWPPRAVGPGTCREVRGDLRDALGGVDLPAGSAGDPVAAVDGLLGALAGVRPAASGELRDCDTLVGNVFVLARALGRERAAALARLARDGAADPEVAALALWRYAAVASTCGDRARGLTREALYDWGTWALDTLGGSAFLARRRPRERALAAFYALLAVDRAARAGHNPAGCDLAGEARRVRALLREVPLRWKDRYLQAVDEIEAAAP